MSEFKVDDWVRVVSHGSGWDGTEGMVFDPDADGFVGIDNLRGAPVGGPAWFDPCKLEIIKADPVNHPAHYTRFPVEVIDITEHLSFNLGNVVKYACRAGRKDGVDPIEDLRKAEFYLKREIGRLSGE